MKLSRTATVALIAAAGLTACNTPDAMVPPMEIGDGGQPVSESDMALSQGQTSAYAEPSHQSAPLSEQGYVRQPQNSLEAQATALAAGQNNPAASTPLYQSQTGYPEASAASEQTLGAPPAQLQPPQQTADLTQQTQQAQPASPSTQAVTALAPAGAAGTIRFLPIIGAPVQAVTPLSRQLGAEAHGKGLTIKSASDPASEHILKGYFSAFGDNGTVTVVYVWDVLDSSGNRLHRIQGQEKVASSATDPWEGVPASLMQQIGTKTIAEYNSWRQARSG
ncbi:MULTISPECIES: hypothetical protein [Alphaproteobacteria]|uniref:Lipoprotein n=2 Tax=Alphaproteobacteria TaxID=28211 RepID=A0A512HEZ0_9HYPH|nr:MULTISPECIES: hypothetical protein [Alphaproteobacteria]GEO83920.1 hypothetical protein RNA01_08520 [Ciceribacter naphthalenivorans]GLR21202.1 hypothetical protein GCM10007920_09880 [Ciceribacter naphthalenivorans]GLT04058.1 hypothetical protein GCM10007926_09880 [Sphingomonas psychrolutea]